MILTLFTLLHLLILVYWLGGDLGAFYGSTFLTDPRRTVPERSMALKLLNNVDMCPRTALILALPTGLTLAWIKGWLAFPLVMLAAVWLLHLVWLAIAWAVHLRHGMGNAGLKRTDIAIRWIMLTGLSAAGVAGVLKLINLPLFIALKLIVLAVAISLGLVVRRQLIPLFPAVREMIGEGPTVATDTVIANVIACTRPVVLLLWALLIVASCLGIAKPV